MVGATGYRHRVTFAVLPQMSKRYSLELFIENCARFEDSLEGDVLEIGVGLGVGHQRFAQAGARLTGIDLTERAVGQVLTH
jgi:2-polyprenyl-3-methyl-5-hydroxy-6-metoxy-1,4-benzoquinol methylase